jgi:hypothetical protein
VRRYPEVKRERFLSDDEPTALVPNSTVPRRGRGAATYGAGVDGSNSHLGADRLPPERKA